MRIVSLVVKGKFGKTLKSLKIWWKWLQNSSLWTSKCDILQWGSFLFCTMYCFLWQVTFKVSKASAKSINTLVVYLLSMKPFVISPISSITTWSLEWHLAFRSSYLFRLHTWDLPLSAKSDLNDALHKNLLGPQTALILEVFQPGIFCMYELR